MQILQYRKPALQTEGIEFERREHLWGFSKKVALWEMKVFWGLNPLVTNSRILGLCCFNFSYVCAINMNLQPEASKFNLSKRLETTSLAMHVYVNVISHLFNL